MTAKQNIELFFNDGFVITAEDQNQHNIVAIKAIRANEAHIKILVKGLAKRFATLRRQDEQG